MKGSAILKNVFILIAAVIFLYSCSVPKTTASSSPVIQHDNRKEIILPPLPELPQSSIQIPVKVHIGDVLKSLDQSTDLEFTSENWPDYFNASCDFRYKYRFVRSPFQFAIRNNEVDISFRGNYQIAGSKRACALNKPVTPWVSGSCGFSPQSLRRVDLNIHSSLKISPDLKISTKTGINKLLPVDKCEVSLLQTDITSEIMDSIRASIESYCNAFDNLIEELNHHELIKRELSSGSRVLPISSYGYLNINPNLLRIGPVNYSNDSLSFSLGLWGNPVFSSDSASLVTNNSFPPVITGNEQPGIFAYLNAVYEYDFFNRLLNDSLQNKPFTVEGRTFVIKEIRLSGNDTGKMQIEVSFTGNRSGVLKLSGTPVFDRISQTLTMPDISYGLDSKDLVVKIAENFFRKKIMRELQNNTVLDIKALIEENKALINDRLNQPLTDYLQTYGILEEISVIGIRPQKNALQLQLFIRGNIGVKGKIDPNQFEFH